MKFTLRKLKGFGLVGTAIATMFLAQTAMADQAEPASTTPTTAQVQPTEPQVDTSAETFNKRLDAIETYIKEDVANNLNESMATAVNSYNSIDTNNQVTNTPKITADDVTLTYDRSKFELTEDYKFTKKPVTISYKVNNKDYMETYTKMQPALATIKNVVADPIIVGTTPKKASEPKAIDDNNTMMSVARGSRQINYHFEDTGNTALTSIKQFVSFYSPFVVPKEVHNQLSPKTDKKQTKETRFETEEGVTIKEAVKGFVEAPTVIDKYQFTGQMKLNDKQNILTYIYTAIEHDVPKDAPIVDKPEFKIDESVPKDAPIVDKPELRIDESVPKDAPIVDKPMLFVTRYVDEKGVEIKEISDGFVNALQTIGEYEFTGKTELNEGKDVQTHVYKHVALRPQKPEASSTGKVTSKESGSNATVKVDEKTPVKADKQLPHTGTASSVLTLFGAVLLFASSYLKKKNL